MKRQLTDWEKMFAVHIFDKGLVSKVYIFFKSQHIKTTNIFFFFKEHHFLPQTNFSFHWEESRTSSGQEQSISLSRAQKVLLHEGDTGWESELKRMMKCPNKKWQGAGYQSPSRVRMAYSMRGQRGCGGSELEQVRRPSRRSLSSTG